MAKVTEVMDDCEPYGNHKYCMLCGEIQSFLIIRHVVRIITSGTLKTFSVHIYIYIYRVFQEE